MRKTIKRKLSINGKPNKTLSPTLFYQQFDTSLSTTNEITKSTKCLILNSKRYCKYLRNYINITQSNTFKVPDITSYPVYKNKDLIPINLNPFSSLYSCSTNQTETGIENKKLNWNFQRKKEHTHTNSSTIFNTALSIKKDSKRFKLYSPKKKNNNEFLSDILFYENKYEDLVYSEKEIFYNKDEYYKDIINESIEKWKNTKAEYDVHQLKKDYCKSNVDIELKLNSMSLELINVTDRSIKPIHINLPFEYLPLFYSKDFFCFKFLILSLVKFNDDYTNISLDILAMQNFIKHSVYFKEIKNKKIFGLLSTGGPIQTEEEKPKKGNIYTFLWNTPKYVYRAILRLPIINLTFNDTQTILTTKTYSKLMLFLIKKNFSNWDFYIINFLFSFKSFRNLIQTYLSKNNVRFSRDSNLYHILPDSIVDFVDKNNYKNDFLYFNTDEQMTNSINIIHSYSMIAYSPKKNFSFKFNLNQMKILSFISQYESLPSFLLKLIIQTTQPRSIKLNYDYFNTFTEEEYKASLQNSNINSNKKNKDIDNLLRVINPYLEKLFIQGNDIESNTNEYEKTELTTNGMIDLFKLDTKEEWVHFIDEKGESILNIIELSPFPEKINTMTSKYGPGGNNLRKSLMEKKIKTPMNSVFRKGLCRFNTKQTITLGFRLSKFKEKKRCSGMDMMKVDE